MDTQTIDSATQAACELGEAWLRRLPAWEKHPVTADGSVSGNYGPTLASEADCALRFARFLNQAGVAWEDMHPELTRVKWMYAITHPTFAHHYNWRVDLALTSREALGRANPPLADDTFRFDAFYEFKLASAYWLHGASYGQPAKLRDSVAEDVRKVTRYVDPRSVPPRICHRVRRVRPRSRLRRIRRS